MSRIIPKNFFITGPPKSGKSTMLMDIRRNLEERGIIISGIICPEVAVNKSRWGFKIISIKTKKEGVLASIETKSRYRVSKYGVNINDLENIGVRALEEALVDESQVVIIDEIGKMELMSKKFENAVQKLLDSKKIILGVVALKYNHPLILKIKTDRKDTKVYYIGRDTSQKTKEMIKQDIIRRTVELLGKRYG